MEQNIAEFSERSSVVDVPAPLRVGHIQLQKEPAIVSEHIN